MHKVAVFFTDSNKRLYDLQQCIGRECPETSHTRLKKRWNTRWAEMQAATLVFKELYPAVVASLENISARDCVDVLQNFRSGDTFNKLFVQAEEVDGRPIQMPRITNMQRHRSNVPADSGLVYYRPVCSICS